MIMNCNRRLNRKIITRFLAYFFHRVEPRHYKLWPEIIDFAAGGGGGRVIKQSNSIIIKCRNKLTHKFI